MDQDIIIAFNKAIKIHSAKEMLEIHEHKTYKWQGEFEPLNHITALRLAQLIYGWRRSNEQSFNR